MKINKEQPKYAVAFVHLPTGEVGRSEYSFSMESAKIMCHELDGICNTILHFPLKLGDDIHEASKARRKNG